MAHTSRWSTSVLTHAYTISIVLCASYTPIIDATPHPSVAQISSGIAIASGIYYYVMLNKELEKHAEQESFINQLILDQKIDSSLKESLRGLIRHCGTDIKRYRKQKNLALCPLLCAALGLGYSIAKHCSPQKIGNI